MSDMMATRMLLNLGNISNKCFLAKVKHYRTKLHVPYLYKHVRGFKRWRGSTEKVHTTLESAGIKLKPLTYSRLWKPFGFVVAFSGATFVGAVIWEYENIKKRSLSGFYKDVILYNQLVHRGWRREVEKWWKNLSDAERIFVPICFLNILVFCAWRIPSLTPMMLRYFSCTPASSVRCWPMVLSIFSHTSLIHLFANMFTLYSLSPLAVAILGREQFVSVYLISGVTSYFASYLYKTAYRSQQISVGASGAIMGILGVICTATPNVLFQVFFIPYAFTASSVIKCLMAVDITGCILKWRYIDHAAHLGGVLLGLFWQGWGSAHLWYNREFVLQLWHSFRKKIE